MTQRTLVRRLLLGAGLAMLACGVPKAYVAERDHFKAALESFNEAAVAVAGVRGTSAGPIPMTPALRNSLMTSIGRGLVRADSVGDPFLAWLHPELPRQFRENLVAGERLMHEALRIQDPARVARSEPLLLEWERYWREHGGRIASKANR